MRSSLVNTRQSSLIWYSNFTLTVNRIVLTLFSVLILSACMQVHEACIEADKNEIAVGEYLTFYDCSNSSANYNWSFGDGNTSGGWESVRHKYARRGIYNVELEISSRYRSTYDTFEVNVGDYVLKSLEINSVTDNTTYRVKSCNRIYFMDRKTVIAANLGDSCYAGFNYTLVNNLSNERRAVSVKPKLKFIHSFYATIDSSQSSELVLIKHTLHIDPNREINLSNQIIYDDVLFFGKYEIISANLVFPLYIDRE